MVWKKEETSGGSGEESRSREESGGGGKESRSREESGGSGEESRSREKSGSGEESRSREKSGSGQSKSRKEEESAKQQELSSKENSAEEAEEISEETAKSRGKFEIKKTSNGRFMFNLRAANTQIIASSQIYASMAACKNGIASIGANASIANTEDQTLSTVNVEKCPKFQIYLDKGGKYRFNLIATNGQNILSCTQGYMQKSSCKNGIHSVIQNSDAPVVMAEETK